MVFSINAVNGVAGLLGAFDPRRERRGYGVAHYFGSFAKGKKLFYTGATSTRRDIKYRNNSLTGIGISGVTMETEIIEGFSIADGRYFTQIEIDHNKASIVIGEDFLLSHQFLLKSNFH